MVQLFNVTQELSEGKNGKKNNEMQDGISFGYWGGVNKMQRVGLGWVGWLKGGRRCEDKTSEL